MPPAKNKPDSPEREEYARFLTILGQRIRALRKQRGWSYRTMVVDHGFHLSAWQSYESGKYGVSMIALLRVAKVFGIPPPELIADIDLDTPAPDSMEEPAQLPAKPSRKHAVKASKSTSAAKPYRGLSSSGR